MREFIVAINAGLALIFLAGIGAIAGIILTSFEMRDLTRVSHQDQEIRQLGAAIQTLAKERRIIDDHLQKRIKASLETAATIADLRAFSTPILESVVIAAADAQAIEVDSDHDENATKADMRPEVELLWSQIEQLRGDADHQLGPHVTKGNIKLRRLWYPQMSELIEALSDKRARMIGETSGKVLEAVSDLEQMREILWRMQCLLFEDVDAMTALVAVGIPISIGDLTQLGERLGRISELQREVATTRLAQTGELAMPLGVVQDLLSGIYQAQRQEVISAGAQSLPFPIVVAEWQTVVEPVQAAMENALLQADNELDVVFVEARSGIVWRLILLAGFLVGLAVVAFGMVWQRARLHAQLSEAALEEIKTKEELRRAVANRFEVGMAGLADELRYSSVNLCDHAAKLTDRAASADKLCAGLDEASTMVGADVDEIRNCIDDFRTSTAEIDDLIIRLKQVSGLVEASSSSCQDKIDSLKAEVSEIDEVVESIASIAQQTSMLSMNATIEAVRAGPAGAGFGVVAREVKALAKQSAQSATQISHIMARIQTMTRDTIEAIGKTNSPVGELALIQDQASNAIAEQTRGIERIVEATSEAANATRLTKEHVESLRETASATAKTANGVAETATTLDCGTQAIRNNLGTLVHELRSH